LIISNDNLASDKSGLMNEIENLHISTKSIHSNGDKYANLTSIQRQKFADYEKNKGNECLRAGEIGQALKYYTISLNVFSTIAGFNNRAICNLKLLHYKDAIDDCTSSLAIKVNFKGLLRRASGYCSIGEYQKSIVDIDGALEIEPESKEALTLRKQIVEKWLNADKSRENRNDGISETLKIKEIFDDNDEIKETGSLKIKEIFDGNEIVQKPKLKIIEVDEDDSDDDF
jgi:tetratricopeptide (TPR) repeat protein